MTHRECENQFRWSHISICKMR